MKTVIIGGCGHIGTYLVPKLVRAGYEVINITRGKSRPYKDSAEWREVEHIKLDREKLLNGKFEKAIAEMNPDIVIDLINFELESTHKMVEVLGTTNLSHYLYCSSIWTHGLAGIVPATEDMVKFPIDEYGKKKLESEGYLQAEYRRTGFPSTAIMPGHISGPGWNIINPVGNLDTSVFQKIADGDEIPIPNFGMETLNHVHADDVAQVFINAIRHRKQAIGESFHAVAKESITLAGYADAMYRWFGKDPKIRFISWDEWCRYTNNAEYTDTTYYHIARSGSYSIEKAHRLIEYLPRHTILETIIESVEDMVRRKVIVV